MNLDKDDLKIVSEFYNELHNIRRYLGFIQIQLANKDRYISSIFITIIAASSVIIAVLKILEFFHMH
jgi:hypothetical protein